MKVLICETILLLQLLDGYPVGGDGIRHDDADTSRHRRGLGSSRSLENRQDRVIDDVDDDEDVILEAAMTSRFLQGGVDVHHLNDRLAVVDFGTDQHRLTSDLFEGDIVVTYDDLAVNYGIDLADQLREDGFVFANHSSAIDGGIVQDGRQRLGRGLGLTSEMYRTWNLPTFRRSDGKLQIPYEINQTSPYLLGETNDTIHLALHTIEKSSGIIAFAPRTNETSYILFEYLSNACAANLGRGNPSKVYLGWCRFKEHKGEMIHEILHALGFWHEQSRPDRDNHVTIVTSNILTYAISNFQKQSLVNSLGSPYDYSSIMHYPPWAFQKSAELSTIVPTRPLEKWEVMGQCGRMSTSDIEQLRIMYQCSAGSRNLASITMDNMCSSSCKCWAYAPGRCITDDDCMGELVCGTTPAVIPKGEDYLDQLPAHTSPDQPTSTSCLTSCHVNCCHLGHNIMMCPETCDTAPPVVAQGPLPPKMCLPPPESPTIPPTSTKIPTKTPTSGPTSARPTSGPTSARPTMSPTGAYTSSTQWFVDWSKNGGMCVADCRGDAPCWRKREAWEAGYPTVEVCCSTMSWKPFKDCSYMPTATITTSTGATTTSLPATTTTTSTTTTTTKPATTVTATSTPGTTTTSSTVVATTTTSTTTTTTTIPATTTSTPGTTSQWYPDETGLAKCKNDDNAPSWLHHRYSSQATCCTTHFSWAYNDCMGVKPTPSLKWYIDWSSGKCKQDCEKTSGASCGGLSPGSWISLHVSSDACCRSHVSYAVDYCKAL
ncbi:hypothetical protein ACHAXA_003134 [Cyclostephanos tholiformis]|uniref:Metalloendopeptidase n=1 Tax=Cyclostephanos tholiformis TaxID=382380 RepID=A0ABD3SSK9_9STRA